MADHDRELLVKIVQYLQTVGERNPSFDAESLQVAAETIQMAVGLDRVPEASGASLLEIFQQVQQDTSPAASAAEHKTGSEDPELEQFLQMLRSRGFFEGTTPGTQEYEALVERAKARFVEKQRKQQEQQSGAPRSQDPKQAAELKAQGNQLLSQGKNREAVQAYSRAIELDSGVALYYANRAAAYLKLEEWALAEADCAQAIRLDPGYTKAYHRQATALERLGRTTDAIAALKAGLKGIDAADHQMLQEFNSAIARLEDDSEDAADDDAVQGGMGGALGGLGAMFGGGGGGGGGFDFGALLNNPMVQQALQDPQTLNSIMGMMGGGGGAGGAGGGGFNLANILNDPATMQSLGQLFGGGQQPQQ